jgi:cell division septal protein FtsQ
MNKVLDEKSTNIEKNSDKTEASKNLCVHDLRRRLKEREKKSTIRKVIILLITIFFISFLFLYYLENL